MLFICNATCRCNPAVGQHLVENPDYQRIGVDTARVVF